MPFSACEVLSERFDTVAGATFSAMLQGSEQLNLLEGFPLRNVAGKPYPQQDRTIVSKLKVIQGVSFLSSALQELFTSPTGKTTIVTQIVLECTTGVGVSVDASAGAERDIGLFNVIPNTNLANFRLAGDVFSLVPTGKSVQIGSGQTLFLNRTAGTGTALLATVNLYGIVV